MEYAGIPFDVSILDLESGNMERDTRTESSRAYVDETRFTGQLPRKTCSAARLVSPAAPHPAFVYLADVHDCVAFMGARRLRR